MFKKKKCNHVGLQRTRNISCQMYRKCFHKKRFQSFTSATVTDIFMMQYANHKEGSSYRHYSFSLRTGQEILPSLHKFRVNFVWFQKPTCFFARSDYTKDKSHINIWKWKAIIWEKGEHILKNRGLDYDSMLKSTE